jgi:XTP/dITP diphosphohydrolase
VTTVGAPIVLATRSTGKQRELRSLLAEAGFAAVSLEEAGVPEEPAVEDGLEVFGTFRENAAAKARHFLARCGGGVVLAEDSGLCVEALGGAPGVRSKRWGTDGAGASAEPLVGAALDRANNARLLAALDAAGARAAVSRGASYVCSAVLVWDGGALSAEGTTAGRILTAPCGAEGFGYDPYFWSTDLDACFGAVSAAAKATVSHRGRAVRAVLAEYAAHFRGTR